MPDLDRVLDQLRAVDTGLLDRCADRLDRLDRGRAIAFLMAAAAIRVALGEEEQGDPRPNDPPPGPTKLPTGTGPLGRVGAKAGGSAGGSIEPPRRSTSGSGTSDS